MVGDAAASVPLTTPDLWLTGFERGLMLAGLALALGGMAGRGLARHYKGFRPGPPPAPWAVRGSLLGAAASAALLITALLGPGLAAQLARPNPPGLTSGGTAQIAAIELVLFAVAAILLRLRRSGPAVEVVPNSQRTPGRRAPRRPPGDPADPAQQRRTPRTHRGKRHHQQEHGHACPPQHSRGRACWSRGRGVLIDAAR